jgi:hypothetical protein
MFTDNKDFYPTPKHIINKMVQGLDFNYIHSILEPETGKGDIVDRLIEIEKPIYGIVPQGYTYESMLYFTKLISMLKNGTKLEELEGSYPSGEEALVSTRMCEAVHESIRTKQIITI